uniref:Methyltransferase n=1 Tax=viral metagenome TaxID=1070528 RepID=A0A6C0KV16_9ZZZZ
MKITYGISSLNIDVTEACLAKMKKDHYLIIPSNDNVRCNYFGDPLLGTLKSIFITVDDITTEYDYSKKIFLDLNTHQVLDPVPEAVRLLDVDERLADIHKNLTLLHGSFRDEFPEQRMAVQYIHPTSKVLEIGGNIGRNSLIIASLLTNQLDMVVLETDPGIAYQLRQNRDQNRLDFHIENSALSKRKLIQKGWDTMVSDELLPGYIPVSIISYDELVKKYKIAFDTLVLDCEGAFYYIVQDMPEVLNGIQTIIMENDYHDIDHKNEVDRILRSHRFEVDYQEAGGWGPCESRFFEVWKHL